MEPTIFESNYINTKEITKEYYRHRFFTKPILIAFDILLLVGFVANILLLITDSIAEIQTLINAPLIFLLQVGLYFRAIYLSEKRNGELSGGKPLSVNTVVTNDVMRFTYSNGAASEISLANIKKIETTKNLILLKSEAKIVFIVPKNSLTKGTPDEFIKFFNSICV